MQLVSYRSPAGVNVCVLQSAVDGSVVKMDWSCIDVRYVWNLNGSAWALFPQVDDVTKFR